MHSQQPRAPRGPDQQPPDDSWQPPSGPSQQPPQIPTSRGSGSRHLVARTSRRPGRPTNRSRHGSGAAG
jgi:hypothetical protein